MAVDRRGARRDMTGGGWNSRRHRDRRVEGVLSGRKNGTGNERPRLGTLGRWECGACWKAALSVGVQTESDVRDSQRSECSAGCRADDGVGWSHGRQKKQQYHLSGRPARESKDWPECE